MDEIRSEYILKGKVKMVGAVTIGAPGHKEVKSIGTSPSTKPVG